VAELSDHLRDLAHRLHPSVLDDLGITSALRVCAQEFQQRERIPVHLTLEESENPLGRHLEECLFRVTQEALRNVAKHANAMHVFLGLSITRIMWCCTSRMMDEALPLRTGTKCSAAWGWSAWENGCACWKAR